MRMKVMLFPLIAASLFAIPVKAQDADPYQRPSLTCDNGPVERYFAQVQWHVLACDDGKSLVFVTGPKSPKDLNFYFIVFIKDAEYKVHGEGNGDKALTKPAYNAITAMSADEIQALHKEATLVSKVYTN